MGRASWELHSRPGGLFEKVAPLPVCVTTFHNDCAADGQRGAQGAEDRHVQELDWHSRQSLARGRQLGRGMLC